MTVRAKMHGTLSEVTLPRKNGIAILIIRWICIITKQWRRIAAELLAKTSLSSGKHTSPEKPSSCSGRSHRRHLDARCHHRWRDVFSNLPIGSTAKLRRNMLIPNSSAVACSPAGDRCSQWRDARGKSYLKAATSPDAYHVHVRLNRAVQ